MIFAPLTVLCGLLLSTAAAHAQSTAAGPLDGSGIVAPSHIRTASGRPGAGYWQQRVDYRIDAALDPGANILRGRERIAYVNRSPDALPYLWLHVEQNICAPGSVTNQLNQPPLRFLTTAFDFSCQGFDGGVVLESVAVGGASARYTVYGTTMRIDLPRPLAAGARLELDISWRFLIPAYGAGRMGRDGSLYQIAQWYPRLAVYDDVRGWNHDPYIGAGEFYLEYGRFDVNLTVPKGYVVAATGSLTNPGAVLTPAQRQRLATAARSDTTIQVITEAEAAAARSVSPGTAVTWSFTADSVRDFAFAAAPDFRWDASGYEGILIHTYYRPAATRWPEANRMAREAVKYFSEQWLRYPWPQMSSVEGPIEGMEYPMITFDPAGPSREDLQWVVAHEIGHQWMPMIVGSNERLYPWMDEGFNTFIDLENAARYFKGAPYGDTIEVQPLHLYAEHAIAGQEQPMILRPVEGKDLFWTAYQKPALMLYALRHQLLGKERFDPAFRDYLRTWSWKHPTPGDFFRLMRDHTGVDLDWYWRDWIYTVNRPDVAVETVTADSVVLRNRGTMQLPVTLRLTYVDGSNETVTLPVDAWNQGDRFVHRVAKGRAAARAEVDPAGNLPDVDRANNALP